MTSVTDPTKTFRILFVCTGNTCRSPMAQGIARRIAADRGWTGVEVRSAGVAASGGMPASGGSLRVARRHGVDLSSHLSRQLDRNLVDWADLVLTMSPGHLVGVELLGGSAKSALITEFAQSFGEPGETAYEGVSDPIGGGDDVYEATFLELDDLVERALHRLMAAASP